MLYSYIRTTFFYRSTRTMIVLVYIISLSLFKCLLYKKSCSAENIGKNFLGDCTPLPPPQPLGGGRKERGGWGGGGDSFLSEDLFAQDLDWVCARDLTGEERTRGMWISYCKVVGIDYCVYILGKPDCELLNQWIISTKRSRKDLGNTLNVF